MAKTNIKTALLALLFPVVLLAQRTDSPIKSPLIGIGMNMVDFSASLPKIGKVDPGFSVSHWNGITRLLDYSVRYNGLFSNYSKDKSKATLGYLNELEGSLHLKALSDNHLFNPFLSAGAGVGMYEKNKFAGYAPLGLGLQLNFDGESYMFLQGNYRVSFDEKKVDNNTFYSVGFAQAIKIRKGTPPPPPPVVVEEVKDRDNDGVPDQQDSCPDVAGLPALKGCPDKDSDGIADADDKCPDVAGLAKYQGCPIPDTDKDAVNDEEDKCPDVPGVARYQGCPIPDTDKDGVNDEEDKCINLPGPASNNGCPEIKEEVRKRVEVAARNIYFATGSAKLLSKSNKSLDQVAKELIDDENLKLDINGHTDNTGTAEKNQTLSEKRAQAVYDYLVKKGVTDAKLKSAGFGQDEPIADNKTAAGRTKNRRVELHLHYD